MARKGHINGLHEDTDGTPVRLDTIFEDEQASVPKRASRKIIRLRSGRRKLFRRRWRIRIPKLKLRRVISPLNMLKKLRDAYVNMMLSLESRGGFGCGGLLVGNQVVYPTVMPGRVIHRHDHEQELRIAGFRA